MNTVDVWSVSEHLQTVGLVFLQRGFREYLRQRVADSKSPSVQDNGAEPVSRLYRLSAVCQPGGEKLVAGAGFEPATFGL
jgi:hypothetical protein